MVHKGPSNRVAVIVMAYWFSPKHWYTTVHPT